MPFTTAKLEIVLRANNAANFITAVEGARKGDVNFVLMSINAFYGEPDVLYAALMYAYMQGVTVEMAPDSRVERG